MENVLPIAATFSKDPKFWGKDFTPNRLVDAIGAHIWGNDDREYIDWISALGANLLGYQHPGFVSRVSCRVGNAGFSLPHYLERQVADKLVNLLQAHIPGWQNQPLGVRFGLSGSDACSMAVRLARAVTGRKWVISIGYHGWHDMFVSTTPPAWGVVGDSHAQAVTFGDIDSLAERFDRLVWWRDNGPVYPEVAAVIIEQTAQDPPAGYWQEVRRLCTAHGALLIVDEVVTWPRFALGGACEYYGVEPDLICIGKGLGNGIPISAIVGRREYFAWFSRSDPCFVSSTHFGNAVSLAAADAVLDIWDLAGVCHLRDIGQHLMGGLRGAGYTVIGQPPRSLLQFASNAERGYFIAGMRDRGILINRPNLPNFAHTLADVAKTVTAAAEVKAEMEQVDVAEVMRGREPAVLFEGR